jgi:solute carrier family 25 (mitochondrial S-adenosylmethionine transporter), member 26
MAVPIGLRFAKAPAKARKPARAPEKTRKQEPKSQTAAGANARGPSASAPELALSFGEQMLAGAVARTVAQTMLHPVDVVRTRLQARGVTMRWAPAVFAKGVLPQVLLAGPAGAIQFVAFEGAKKRLEDALPGPSARELRLLLAGAIGALCAASCRVPQEVIKQRIQADIYPNMAVALRETLATSGPAGLYNGWLATVSRDIPWNALSFMFHGRAKGLFAHFTGRPPRTDENLALAGGAGAIAAVIMTPVDVVKTRLMTQRAGDIARYTGIVGTLRRIIAEEGAATLMRGVIPRILFLAPLAGITFSVYEAVAGRIRARKVRAAVATTTTATDGMLGSSFRTSSSFTRAGNNTHTPTATVAWAPRARLCPSRGPRARMMIA